MVIPSTISDFGSPIRMIPDQEPPEFETKYESPKTKQRAVICLLLLAYLIVLNICYNLWVKQEKTPISKILTANIIYDLWTKKVTAMKAGTVVGILYNSEKPCALINRELVHEGDITNGVKIIKIDESKVEFEKNSQRWTQKLMANPNLLWKAKK